MLDFDGAHCGETARPSQRRADIERAGLGILTGVEEEAGDQVAVWPS